MHAFKLLLLSTLTASVSAARISSALWDITLEYSAALNTVLVSDLHFFAAANFTSNLAMPPGDPSFPFTLYLVPYFLLTVLIYLYKVTIDSKTGVLN